MQGTTSAALLLRARALLDEGLPVMPAILLPDLSGLENAKLEPQVIAAFAEIVTSLEALQARRRQEVDPTTMIMMMLMTSAERIRAVAPTPTGAEISKYSKELIEALDRADEVAVAAALAPGFVYFHASRTHDRDTLLGRLAQRRSKVQLVVNRTWEDESVVHKDDVLVFTANVREVHGETSGRGGYSDDGTYLVQWVRTQDGWRVQLLTWHRGVPEREYYNDTFRKNRGFSHEPNRLLIDTVRGTAPGTALDLAMGQGRNALYLASQNWTVTGIDVSDEGINIAREEAAQRKLSLETINADIDEWELGQNRFDLVTMFYAGDHLKWIDKIRTSLRDGGLFVVEGWAKESPDSPYGFAEGQLAKLFEGYEILRDETVDGAPDWAWDEGRLVRFVARKRHG